MRLPQQNILVRLYEWVISAPTRIGFLAALLAVLFGGCAWLFSPVVSGLLAALVVLTIGGASYLLRRSGAALAFPQVDRLFQQVPCYLSIQDKNLRIIRTNQRFRDDFGDRVGELCHRVYKGSDTACPDCPVIKTFADGKTYSTEETVITKDGRPAQMIVYTTPVVNEQGDIIGVMEMSTNITEVKELQEQIDASRKEFRELFERVPCYITILDENLRITRVNEQYKKEFGDAAGEYCYSIYKGRDSACPDCHALKTMADGQIHSGETSVVKSDGTEAKLLFSTAPIYDDHGEVKAVMEMATDITEVKRLQKELTYMGKTIAVMAHRIKNIVMGLEGGIFVVNTGMEDGDEVMVKKGWGMIERNVAKVSQIVKDLLYCSKEREMKFQQIDPAPVVHSVYELFHGRATKEAVVLRLKIPEKLPLGRFDPEALHSLLANLVTNAMEACVNDADGGKTEHAVEIRTWCDSRCGYVFEIEDNGAGIPGTVGECVFEDFYSTKGREGTGLGLLVAQKVVDEHGGTITFRSDEGKGTVFRAIFPPVE